MNKQDTQRTPTPWHIGMKPGPMIYGERGEQVADCSSILMPDKENAANARMIVRAVNAHDDLMAALEALLNRAVQDAEEYAPEGNEPIWAFINDASDALVKAKGGSQ